MNGDTGKLYDIGGNEIGVQRPGNGKFTYTLNGQTVTMPADVQRFLQHAPGYEATLNMGGMGKDTYWKVFNNSNPVVTASGETYYIEPDKKYGKTTVFDSYGNVRKYKLDGMQVNTVFADTGAPFPPELQDAIGRWWQ